MTYSSACDDAILDASGPFAPQIRNHYTNVCRFYDALKMVERKECLGDHQQRQIGGMITTVSEFKQKLEFAIARSEPISYARLH